MRTTDRTSEKTCLDIKSLSVPIKTTIDSKKKFISLYIPIFSMDSLDNGTRPRLLIIGGSGQTGSLVIDEALERG